MKGTILAQQLLHPLEVNDQVLCEESIALGAGEANTSSVSKC